MTITAAVAVAPASEADSAADPDLAVVSAEDMAEAGRMVNTYRLYVDTVKNVSIIRL